MLLYYFKRLSVFAAAYAAFSLLMTLIFTCQSLSFIDLSFFALFKTGASWLFFLIAETMFFIVPFAFYLLILPQRFHNTKFDKISTGIIFTVSLYLVAFKSIAEYFFWDEFSSRFNFIAVDYLVYTQEVVKNIHQSYPVIPILITAFVIVCITSFILSKFFINKKTSAPSFKSRFLFFTANIAVCAVIALWTSINFAEVTGNRFNNELAKGGAYGFVYAFCHNEIEYDVFYPILAESEVDEILAGKTNFAKIINPAGKEIRPNVIIVLMESMSAKYLTESAGENKTPLTPNLNRFAKNGIFFPNTYATGTRTVRGIEALTISVPPLPGMSIVRRNGNENIYTIGSIFRSKGYITEFIYGGNGFFDNMNYYFKNNGFAVTDKLDFAKNEITFANAWGVSDEDLFVKTIQRADALNERGEKFFLFALTTSNHRPFTYPEGKIDLPQGNRAGSVKYADYAVGRLVEIAKTKPWFNNTVFVFVADHEAGSAGKDELNPAEHRIPLIIYAPKLLRPKTYQKAISQIDALPTLLSLLNFKYESRFFGQDATADNYQTRYFLINYQKVGFVQENTLTLLKPVKQSDFYKLPYMEKIPKSESDYKLAISFFQKASNWRELLK